MNMKQSAIRRLSDRELHERVHGLVLHERKLTLEVVEHLIEVDRRRLYAVQAYSSLFAYCVGYLGYSNAAAARRVSAARAVRRFPRVREMLERRGLSLSTLSLISGELRKPDAGELIDAVRGKSRRDAEAVLARFRGPVVQRERIRQVIVCAPRASGVGGGQIVPPGTISGTDTAGVMKETAGAAKGEAPADLVRRGLNSGQVMRPQPHTIPEIRKMFRFEFAGDTEFFSKYERAAAILSSRVDMPTTIEQVMNLVFDVFLEQRDPVRRQARRERRKKRARARTETAHAV